MKHKLLLLFLISILFPSVAFSKTISSAPAEVIRLPENEQFAMKEAFINRDWESVQLITSKYGTFAVYDAQKIQDFLTQYDQCRRQPDPPLSCYSKVQDKWNNLPRTTVLGTPTADFLNTLNEIFLDDVNRAIQREKNKKDEEIKKSQMEKELSEGERKKGLAAEEAERFRQRQQEEHALKQSEEQRQRNADKCAKIDGQTPEETKVFSKVTDGERFNSLVIDYLIMKSKQKPLPPECGLPHVVEAEKIPYDYRGKPVQAYGKIIELQVDKRDLAGSNEFVAGGMIQWENHLTYFFTPGRAAGFKPGDYVFIEGYFAQMYSDQKNTGDHVAAPVVVGRLRK